MECEVLTCSPELGGPPAILWSHIPSGGRPCAARHPPLPLLLALCQFACFLCVCPQSPSSPRGWGLSPRPEVGELGDWRVDGQGRRGVPAFGVGAGGWLQAQTRCLSGWTRARAPCLSCGGTNAALGTGLACGDVDSCWSSAWGRAPTADAGREVQACCWAV